VPQRTRNVLLSRRFTADVNILRHKQQNCCDRLHLMSDPLQVTQCAIDIRSFSEYDMITSAACNMQRSPKKHDHRTFLLLSLKRLNQILYFLAYVSGSL